MKEIKKISVQELDILAQEAACFQAEAAGIPCEADMNPILLKPQSDHTSQVVLLLLHLTKGNPGYTVLSIFKKGIRMVKQNDKNSLGHFAY